MREAERETPGLCKNCQQWLCASKDAFCACCGAGLVVAALSTNRLVFSQVDGSAAITIANQGLFRLYWAAEIIAPEPSARALFAIEPDYGIIAPGNQQTVKVRLLPEPEYIRADLEIASNDPRRPSVKIALGQSGEGG